MCCCLCPHSLACVSVLGQMSGGGGMCRWKGLEAMWRDCVNQSCVSFIRKFSSVLHDSAQSSGLIFPV